MPITCDLFCKVVDNFGDAAVCWRLARQLAAEHGWRVTLWIDALAPLALLRPGLELSRDRQVVDAVEVRRWSVPFPAPEPGDVVVEAFACELPVSFVHAMASRERQPVWINLEYLSAEEWIAGCHGLASPHPSLPLVKYFYFPGFVAGTGGLIKEKHLVRPVPDSSPDEFRISLFCYANAALPRLLDTWASSQTPLHCFVADGWARDQVERWLDVPFPSGCRAQRGLLTLEALPFLAQDRYDEILATCDLNFVRGEDSFVRAQWMERPFVWQIYPQAEGAHTVKLEAFLELYSGALHLDVRKALSAFWRAWNGAGAEVFDWSDFRDILPALRSYGPDWAKHLSAQGNLAENLVSFCIERL